MRPQITTVATWNPNATALATMGSAARRTADSWTMREWASRLATLAPPRDYVGQLRALYEGIIDRWRYVQENGEWVNGSPRAVLGYTLGANYNCDPKTCPHPERCDVARTRWKNYGWGDCDDVATLTAAGVLAIGGTPFFRTARGPGGAHVSVTARTPAGDLVDLDPVGHPEHRFGWAVDGAGIQVEHFDLDGRPVALGGAPPMMGHAFPVSMPQLQPLAFGGYGYLGDIVANTPGTYLLGIDEVAQMPRQHLALVHPADTRGPRVIAIPEWHASIFRRGAAWHGTPGVDQFGDAWVFDQEQDLWVPSAVHSRGRPMGAWDFGRRRLRLFRRIGRFLRRVVGRVVKGVRRVVGKILSSKLAQRILSRILMAVGVPPPATRALMAASGSILRRGGLIKLLRLARKSPRKALQFLAKAAAEAGKAAMLPALGIKVPGLSGPDGVGDRETMYAVQTAGGSYHAVPVAALAGCPGVYEFGQLDVADTPTPGKRYRIRKGDTLLGVTGKAYGLGSGAERLKRSKWINDAEANQVFHRPTTAGFERNAYGDSIVSFSPKFSCDADAAIAGEKGSCFAVIWIPPAKGVEPPTVPIEPPPPGDICPEGLMFNPATMKCEPIEAPPPEEPEEPKPEPPPPPVQPPEEPVEPPVLPPEPEPEEPVIPAPPVEPKPPPEEPEGPFVPEPEEPVEEECPQGFMRRVPGGPCEMIVPMCREPLVWNPTTMQCMPCPSGTMFDPNTRGCTAVVEPPPPPIEPVIPEEPPPPVQPPVFPPAAPTAGGVPRWAPLLLLFLMGKGGL